MIKRYDFAIGYGDYNGHFVDDVECDDGDWIKYADHLAESDAARKRIAELERELRNIRRDAL